MLLCSDFHRKCLLAELGHHIPAVRGLSDRASRETSVRFRSLTRHKSHRHPATGTVKMKPGKRGLVLTVDGLPKWACCWRAESGAGGGEQRLHWVEVPVLDRGRPHGPRAIPPCRASPQPERARPIIQSTIARCPGSFLTGSASRGPSSRPLPGSWLSFRLCSQLEPPN